MKRVATLLICCGLALLLAKSVSAQILYPQFSQSKGTSVSATVGRYHVNITGFQSPFASIILKTQNGVFLASTTTDSKGYFSISNLLINTSGLTYCFQAVDFKRVGLSEACITIPADIKADITYNNVFLPPTIALSKKQINAGQDAVIFGYSMPGATVSLNIGGKITTVTSDKDGYYTYLYKNVPEGVFRISATATLLEEKSLDPTNVAILEALPLTKQITNKIADTLPKPSKAAFSLLPFIFIALALLTAIGILLYKLKLKPWMILVDFLRKRKKMHHDWFLDKW